MINSKQLVDLPEVFVSFETERIEGCRVVYLNETLANGQDGATLLDHYSYLVNTSNVPNDQAQVKTFMAERYGGDGIARNGGGGRCGFDGVWQLKGLGPNQLVDHTVDLSHRDGYQCLHTALYESIWAEIIHEALPHGAVRTVAVLDTGLAYEKYGQPKIRGLIVREPVVRPAHFIRAIYFKQKHIDTLGEDAQRVKAAIGKLVDFLPFPEKTAGASSQQERLESGLLELAARYAEQFAASRAKHISHNNVSESNIALNGAWLDVSGARLFTSVVSSDRLDIERFNTEYTHAVYSLESVCYYLGKYSVLSTETSLRFSHTVIQHFTHQYYRYLNVYEVAQAGFPLWAVKSITDHTAFLTFSRHLRELLARNDFSVTTVKFGDDWEGHERWTGRLYIALLTAKAKTTPLVTPAGVNLSDEQAEQLHSSFNQLFELACSVANEHGISQPNFYRCMAINATRLNRSPLVLHELTARIKGLRLNAQPDKALPTQALADEAMQAAKLHLGNEEGLTIPFWRSDKLVIEFDPVAGLFIVNMAGQYLLPFDVLPGFGVSHNEVRTALQFYRETWSMINDTSL